MKKLGKSYETHTYEGAGHGFLRAQGDRDGANLKAAQQTWPRTVAGAMLKFYRLGSGPKPGEMGPYED
jgi:dienelactone hydrolase